MYANYDYYRIFYYVARYGGVSQAAKVLSALQVVMLLYPFTRHSME